MKIKVKTFHCDTFVSMISEDPTNNTQLKYFNKIFFYKKKNLLTSQFINSHKSARLRMISITRLTLVYIIKFYANVAQNLQSSVVWDTVRDNVNWEKKNSKSRRENFAKFPQNSLQIENSSWLLSDIDSFCLLKCRGNNVELSCVSQLNK